MKAYTSVLFFLSLAHCSSSSVDTAAAAKTAQSYCEGKAIIYCEQLFSCSSSNELGAVIAANGGSEEACIAKGKQACAEKGEICGPKTYDPVEGERCLEAVQSLKCNGEGASAIVTACMNICK